MAPTVISPFLILKSRIYMVLQEKDKNLLRSLHQGTSSRVIGSSKLQRCWRSCKRSDIYSETEGALGVTSRKRLFIIAYNAYSPLSCHSRLQGVGENKEEGRYRGREGGNEGKGRDVKERGRNRREEGKERGKRKREGGWREEKKEGREGEREGKQGQNCFWSSISRDWTLWGCFLKTGSRVFMMMKNGGDKRVWPHESLQSDRGSG